MRLQHKYSIKIRKYHKFPLYKENKYILKEDAQLFKSNEFTTCIKDITLSGMIVRIIFYLVG